MKGYFCPRTGQECPNGTELETGLCISLRIAYEDHDISIKELSEVLRRHHCTIRHAIVSAGGTIRHSGPYSRRAA